MNHAQEQYDMRNDVILFVIALVLWVIGGYYVGTNGAEWFMPEAASVEAEAVDNLFQVMLGIATAIFLMVETLIIYLAVRYGWMRNHQDETDAPHIHGSTRLEIFWTFIPTVLVIFLTIYSVQVLVTTTEAKEDELAIDVVGQRFFWQFQYPDDEFELNSNHNLVVPVDQTVRLRLTSNDVIHAFWVPAFRVKNDVMPGRVSELRFTPSEVTGLPSDFELATLDELDIPGPDTACPTEEETAATEAPAAEEEEVAPAIASEDAVEAPPVDDPLGYDLVCAELCGASHGLMRGEVYVVTREEYDAYIETLRARIVEQKAQEEYAKRCGGAELLAAGRAIFAQYGCTTCHQLTDAESLNMGAGPSLNGVGARAATRPGYDSAEAYILTSVINPNAYVVDGYTSGIMPQNFADQIAPDQLELLVAYLALQAE